MPKEGRFYVEYLGWKETRGLYGSEYTDAILRKLIGKRQTERKLHRMTIKISRDELQISQDKTSSHGKTQKIKYPPQPMCDVSHIAQCASPHSDVVGCIFLGYNMYTQCASHVHAYRFDRPETAAYFVKLVNAIIDQSDYRERIMAMSNDLLELERGKARGGELTVSKDTMGSDAGSYGSHSPNSSDSGVPRSYPSADEALKQRKDIVIKRSPSQKKPEQPKAFTHVQDELTHKLALQQQKDAPILLPPKDYNTIVRRHGHLSIRAKVKQRSIITANVFDDRPTTNGDSNNNPSVTKTGESVGQRLHKQGSSDSADGGSPRSSFDEDASVYGLYKGLQPVSGSSSLQEEMAMWSPEYTFGHQSASSDSSGFQSSTGSGLRRFKMASSTKF